MVLYYPASIDNDNTWPPIVDGTPVTAKIAERLRQTIISIEKELGVKPSGTYTTVRARLDALEGIIGNLRIIELNNDLGGTLDQPMVIGIQGRPVSTAPPSVGEVLVWNGIAWVPAPGPGAEVHFDGDLTGTPLSQTVIGINTIPVRKAIERPVLGDANKFLQAKPVYDNPYGMIFDGTNVWVRNGNNDVVAKFNPSNPDDVQAIILPDVPAFSNGNSASIAQDATHVFVIADGRVVDELGSTNHAFIFIIEKATNNIVGRIATPDENYTFSTVTVNGNDIFASTADPIPSPENNSYLVKYSKSAALSAFPNSVSPVQTLPPSSGNVYNYGMCFGGGYLFVTSGTFVFGQLYKIDPTTMTVLETYTQGSPVGFAFSCIFAFGSVWLSNFHESSYGVSRFDPNDISAAQAFIATPSADILGFDDISIWSTELGGNAINRISTTPGSEEVIATLSNPPYTYSSTVFDGNLLWAGTPGSVSGVTKFYIDPGNEEWLAFYGGQLQIAYSNVQGGGVTFYNDGDEVITSNVLNLLGGGGVFGADGDDATLTINALPPPGNQFDYLRLLPDSPFSEPRGIYYDEAASMLWITNLGHNRVVKIDVSDYTTPVLVAEVEMPHVNGGYRIIGDDNYVYITSYGDGYVIVIDKATEQVVGVGFSGGTITAITQALGDDNDVIWIVNQSSGEVQKFSVQEMLDAFPSAAFNNLSATIPDGVVDWEVMCYVGGEGGYMTNGSGGFIYQFSSNNDGFTTLFNNYGNPPFYYGIQLAGLVHANHSIGSDGLWTSSLGSQLIQFFSEQNLNSGPPPASVFDLGGFTAEMISDGSVNPQLWINSSDGTVWRVFTPASPGSDPPILLATISTPAADASGIKFIGMAYDGTHDAVWMVDPTNNTLLRIDNSTDSVGLVWAGDSAPTWGQGDVIFDTGFGKSNLRSTKNNQSPVNSGKNNQLNFSTTDDAGYYSTNANYSVILSGHNNKVDGEYSIIMGGFNNWILDLGLGASTVSFIGGGSDNVIQNSFTEDNKWNTIVGGEGHFINDSIGATIAGGHANQVGGGSDYATMGGGQNNQANGFSSTVSGGQHCITAGGQWTTIAGGFIHHAYGEGATISGGAQNDAVASYSTISGGFLNQTGISVGDENPAASYIGGGTGAMTLRYAQMAHAGGAFAFTGDNQFSRYFVKGAGDGSGDVELLDVSGNPLNLTDGTVYAIRATCVAIVDDGSQGDGVFIDIIHARCYAGTASILNQTRLFGSEDQGWDIFYDVAGNAVTATFDPGGESSFFRAMVTYEWSELSQFPI